MLAFPFSLIILFIIPLYASDTHLHNVMHLNWYSYYLNNGLGNQQTQADVIFVSNFEQICTDRKTTANAFAICQMI